MTNLAEAVVNGTTTDVGNDIGKLLSDWSSITGGCKSDDSACSIIEGLLRLVQAVASDVAPCEAALSPAIADLTAGAAAWQSKNYTSAVGDFATALDVVANALTQDSCGLSKIADALSSVSPKLKAAVVKIESSGAVHIIVESADIYESLYTLVRSILRGDWTTAGEAMGALVGELKAAGCESKACVVVEGILQAFQLEIQDYAACSKDLDAAFDDLSSFASSAKAGSWADAVKYLSGAAVQLSHGVSGCGVDQLGTILEDVATKLGAAAVSADIGKAVSIIEDGADITLEIQAAAADAQAQNWRALGTDLGAISADIVKTGCKSYVCKLLEGILEEASIAFEDLETCEADFQLAEQSFSAGYQYMKKNDALNALKYWSAGLDDVAKSVKDCGVAQELQVFENEAQLLGFGNISIVDDAVKILVHGADFYDNFYQAVQDIERHDWRSAGSEFGKVINQLAQWTEGHACTNDFCYVVLGVFQFLGDIEGDVRACEADFKLAFTNLTQAAELFTDHDKTSSSGIFHFNANKDDVKKAVGDIGYAFRDIAHGVSDCHLAELAQLLADLAEKLGIAPEIQWVEELLKILIDGVEIENEIADACQ